MKFILDLGNRRKKNKSALKTSSADEDQEVLLVSGPWAAIFFLSKVQFWCCCYFWGASHSRIFHIMWAAWPHNQEKEIWWGQTTMEHPCKCQERQNPESDHITRWCLRMFSHWVYLYSWQLETSASKQFNLIIIRYCSNTYIKPILYKRVTHQTMWLTCSQTHLITMLKNLFYGNDFSAWHLGQHFLFLIHINNRNLNLPRLIVIFSLDQRFSRRKVRAVWRYTGSLLFPQMKEYKVREERGANLHDVYAEQWPLELDHFSQFMVVKKQPPRNNCRVN